MAQAGLADEVARGNDPWPCIVGRPSHHEHFFSQLRVALPVIVTALEATSDESIEGLLRGTYRDWSDGRRKFAIEWGALLLSAEQRRQRCPMLVAYVHEQSECTLLEHFGCDDAGEEGLPAASRRMLGPILKKLGDTHEQRVAPLHDAHSPACAPPLPSDQHASSCCGLRGMRVRSDPAHARVCRQAQSASAPHQTACSTRRGSGSACTPVAIGFAPGRNSCPSLPSGQAHASHALEGLFLVPRGRSSYGRATSTHGLHIWLRSLFPSRLCGDCFDELGATTASSDEASDHELEQEQDAAVRGELHGARPSENGSSQDNSSQETAISGDGGSEDGSDAGCSPMECPTCRAGVLWSREVRAGR